MPPRAALPPFTSPPLLRPCQGQAPGGCGGHLNGRLESRLEEILPEDADVQGEARLGWVPPEPAAQQPAGVWLEQQEGAAAPAAPRCAHWRACHASFSTLPPCCVRCAVAGVLRIALSQLDARKRDLNDSASWVISDFFDKVRALLGAFG